MNELTPFTQEAMKHTAPYAARMNPGDKTDTKRLFDPDFWEQGEKANHKQYGRAVSTLVNLGLLPLEHAGLSSSRHNLYRRI